METTASSLGMCAEWVRSLQAMLILAVCVCVVIKKKAPTKLEMSAQQGKYVTHSLPRIANKTCRAQITQTFIEFYLTFRSVPKLGACMRLCTCECKTIYMNVSSILVFWWKAGGRLILKLIIILTDLLLQMALITDSILLLLICSASKRHMLLLGMNGSKWSQRDTEVQSDNSKHPGGLFKCSVGQSARCSPLHTKQSLL